MTQVRLTRGALNDIRRVLRRSEMEFGVAARDRYRVLLDQALRDLAEDQDRIGVKPIADVRPEYFAYHLKWSKSNVGGASVGRPRHLLVYSVNAVGDLIIAALVHEREMLERHLEQ